MDYYHGYGVTQNYEKAVYWWEKASNNNICAKYNLGVFYFNGYGVKKNKNLAFKYYEIASKMEVPSALYNLANMYYTGEGTSADIINAMIYYEKAAQKGHKKAEAICQQLKAILMN